MNSFKNNKMFISNIEKNYKPFLILEAGINHEGNIEIAKKLIDHAKFCGANAIKFQYFELDDFYLKGSVGYKNLKKMYLNKSSILKLSKYAKKKKITFLCTAYFEKSFDFLEHDVNVDAHKISSMDNNNIELIKHISSFKKPMIISTGMSSLKNLIKIKNVIKKYHNNFCFLHCISNYPTKPEDLNLVNIKHLKQQLNVPIGFSDHSQNIYGMINALNFDPIIIEKHFTFDKSRPGFDHNISADKDDIINYYNYLNFSKRSNGKKFKSNFERPDNKNQKIFRKGFYYKYDFAKGNKINPNDILKARPGKNFHLNYYFNNKKKYILKKNVKKFQIINKEDFI